MPPSSPLAAVPDTRQSIHMSITAEIKQTFYQLTISDVLSAVEAAGFPTTGEYFQLNSYENRVFDVFLEPELTPAELNQHLIVKFYRPHRWSEKAIQEEHFFLEELNSVGLPVIAPIHFAANNSTLFPYKQMWMAAFRKGMGRMPQEFSHEDLQKVGRTLARLHNVGSLKTATHRPNMNVDDIGEPALQRIEQWCAPEVWTRYNAAAIKIFDFLDEHLNESEFIRIHGDCHRGNLLKTDPTPKEREAGIDSEFFFVDFDDFCNGPEVQDFWMLLSGPVRSSQDDLNAILTGYDELREVPEDDLRLIPALQGLRVIHYSGWIARRWEDPTFPQLFPQFKDYLYWAEDTEALEQIAWSL